MLICKERKAKKFSEIKSGQGFFTLGEQPMLKIRNFSTNHNAVNLCTGDLVTILDNTTVYDVFEKVNIIRK